MILEDILTGRELGLVVENYLAYLMLRKKFRVIRPKSLMSPFDLLVNDKRVEIKCARPFANNQNKWGINIHRHGKLKEQDVDIYAILLDLRHLGKVKPLVLFREAPIRAKTIVYSVESLLTIHHSEIENWKLFE